MTRIVCIALASLCVCGGHSTAADTRKPNIIFILADDQGWSDARFAGHPYAKTPNLDRFASQGTWFKQFYVAATVCSPSRCSFMTSHYPARHLVHGHFATHGQNAARSMPDWLDPEVPTITRLLQQAGYTTGHFGKWHLGSGVGAPEPGAYGINKHVTLDSNGPQLREKDATREPYWWGKPTGIIMDHAIAFVRENKDKPFYLNVWTLLPHAKLDPTPEQLAVYDGLAPHAEDPAFGRWMQEYLGAAKDLKRQMRVYCASLTDLDTQVGRLLATLDELGLAENTIVFYSSDNGAEDYNIANASNAGVGNTGPLRARKRSMYEGGVRTFGLLRWPGRVAAGRVDDTSVVSAVDWLPTVCKQAGVELPAELRPDGEDVSDIWFGKSRPRSKPLHWEWLFRVWGDDYMPPMLAIRDGPWKLFVNHNGSGAQLYDIPKDISEEHNVAGEHADVVKDLTAKALAWQKTLPPSKARNEAASAGRPVDAARPAAKGKGESEAKAATDRTR
ncbi:MAG: sulfatase-like hydrolase/transferase [Verrucomicrobia bacterium]|nr:sulfatase-like hydrolase/transferase [Verrucomicrobiota bacterium]